MCPMREGNLKSILSTRTRTQTNDWNNGQMVQVGAWKWKVSLWSWEDSLGHWGIEDGTSTGGELCVKERREWRAKQGWWRGSEQKKKKKKTMQSLCTWRATQERHGWMNDKELADMHWCMDVALCTRIRRRKSEEDRYSRFKNNIHLRTSEIRGIAVCWVMDAMMAMVHRETRERLVHQCVEPLGFFASFVQGQFGITCVCKCLLFLETKKIKDLRSRSTWAEAGSAARRATKNDAMAALFLLTTSIILIGCLQWDEIEGVVLLDVLS